MAGIYDEPVGALDPRAMAMLQAGLGVMGASGPSMTPVSMGQALARGGQQGIQGFQQAQQANQQNQLFAMKMAEQKRAEEERARLQAAQGQLLSRPEFAQYAPLVQAGVPLSSILERAMPKPKAAEDFTLGNRRYRGDGTLIVEAPEGPMKPQSDLGRLEADFKAGLITAPDYEAKRKKLTTHQPLVDMRQESEFNKKVGSELGEQYSGLMKADFAAPTTIGKYQRLGSLLGQVNTGKFKGTTTELKAAAKSLGFDPSTLGVGDDVAPAQAARALSNQLALELRNPAGGAGMPGALSDKDREFLVQSLPTLESDPGAVGKMIEYRVKLAQREQKVARMARDYRRKNGKFDEGFFDELQDWSANNPLFGNEKLPSKPAQRIRFDAQGNQIQ